MSAQHVATAVGARSLARAGRRRMVGQEPRQSRWEGGLFCKPLRKQATGSVHSQLRSTPLWQPNANTRASRSRRRERRERLSGTLSPRCRPRLGKRWRPGGGQDAALQGPWAKGWVYSGITGPPEVTWLRAALGSLWGSQAKTRGAKESSSML